MRTVLIILLVLIGACVLVGVVEYVRGDRDVAGPMDEEPPALIRTQRFELVDTTGQVQAVMAFQPGGGPYVELQDERGEVRAMLGLLTDGRPSLTFWDEKGTIRALLLVDTDDPRLGLFDARGEVGWSAAP